MDKAQMQEMLDKQTAPKVTKESMDKRIAGADFYILSDGRTTICSITLDNGFTVRGESSCVSKENFNKDIGETFAYEDAYRKLWILYGFLLAEDLYRLRTQESELHFLSAVGQTDGR